MIEGLSEEFKRSMTQTFGKKKVYFKCRTCPHNQVWTHENYCHVKLQCLNCINKGVEDTLIKKKQAGMLGIHSYGGLR